LCAVPFERLVEIFDQPELESAPELAEALPRAKASKLLTAMSADRAADILRELDEPPRSELLGALAPPLRATLLSILGYPEGSAASIMTTEFVSVPSDWTVGRTLDYIRKVERTRETIYAIYIVDPETQLLLRSTGLRRLITGNPEDLILSVAPDRMPVTVTPLTDRENLAQTISKYDLLALPVVDHGRILGIVTVDDIIDTMIEETTEDVHRFGGMEALDEPYMKMGFLAMIQKRAGWLCALFLSEMLTANAMQSYEGELEKAIVLTLFIPLIMSSGGNSGSQATSLVIRALALREIGLRDWWRVALRELPTGVVLGSILGVVGICR
ncbi:magnesium transporter, partial [Mesorhizobium sp. M2A.F.Ca.ET.040.01.1.1]